MVDTKLNVLICGTGEYVTGYVATHDAAKDKKAGVVGLVLFDLRQTGRIGTIGVVGVNGTKFPDIKRHLKERLGDVYNMDTTFDRTYPEDGEIDRNAYKRAIDGLSKGDAVLIFTPDDTHYEIAAYAIDNGMHVMIAKPAVKTVEHHRDLLARLEKRGNDVLVAVDYHKRFDPIYADAVMRIRQSKVLYFYALMTQPKSQLQTFSKWAGKTSDISYYLNAHHVDIHCWAMSGRMRPYQVSAASSSGAVAARSGLPEDTEDVITLTVSWRDCASKDTAVGVYTASWAAPSKGECHSQQRFQALTPESWVEVDQAHRGYSVTDDENGYTSQNPLYMKYTKHPITGRFDGQDAYGYKSISCFVDACLEVNRGSKTPEDFEGRLPTLSSSLDVTRVLEAGRKSLDMGGKVIEI